MINAIQHSILCETLTIWAAEFAAGFPTVHQVVYDILHAIVIEFEACAAAVEEAVEVVEECEEIGAELVGVEQAIGLGGSIVPVLTIRNDEMGSGLFRHRMPHWGILEHLGIHRGCRLKMRKRIGSTPELVECVDSGKTMDTYGVCPDRNPQDGSFRRPDACPFCGGHLYCSDNEMLVCPNPDCKTKIGDRIVRFVTIGGMGIPTITETVVEQLLVGGKLDTIEGLYALDVDDFIDACHVTHTDAYMMVKLVARSKMKPMHMLLDGLGMDGIGKDVTPIMAWCIGECGGMRKMVSDEETVVTKFFKELSKKCMKHGIPSSNVKTLKEFSLKNRSMLRKLVELGVAQEPIRPDGLKEEKPRAPRGKRMRRRKGKPGGDSGNG